MADSAQIVQSYYEAFNAKDYGAMLDLVHENVCHEVNQGETRWGKDLFRAFLLANDEAYDETLTDLVIFTEPSGSRVAVEFKVNGIYKKGSPDLPPAFGQAYKIQAGAFLAIADDKIVRVTTYYNLPNWIEAVSQPASNA